MRKPISYTDGPVRRRGSSHINDTVIAGLMIGIAGAPRFWLMPMPRERENLVRDINGLKESISLAWMDMISKPMTAMERGELRKSIDSLVKDLDNLRSRLDRLPKLGRNVARTPTVDLRVWPIHLRSVKTRASHVSFS